MTEGAVGGGQDFCRGSKPASINESAGGRHRLRVELRPGETTIVSWKKLLKEANLSERGGSGPSCSGTLGSERQDIPQPPSAAPASSRQLIEKDPKDAQAQAGSNRLSTVIERIERMYAGDGSSDDEAGVLKNVPYEDEYDTDDSFIDDAELDDYFQVDNSAIKHDGFFVNRGKLERIEPAVSLNQQPKKRRRKHGGSDDGCTPNKIVKVGEKGKRHCSSLGAAVPGITGEAVQFRDTKENVSEVVLKKNIVDAAVNVVPLGVVNVDAYRQNKETDQRNSEILSLAKHSSKMKDNCGLPDTFSERSTDKSIRREGSGGRPRSVLLDKAIKELEKIVAESRPPSTEVQVPDNASQAVKKRLPPEIKVKLAKVARLAQASSGTIPKDVISRLMGIVGHLMQVRTLKRNLKLMAKIGLSAKQEKDDRIQGIKEDIAEMVKLRVSSVRSKVEQLAANSDGIQEDGQEKKDSIKRKYCMDERLENKISELYDLYLEGLEEDLRPSARRLFEELALLWPSGFMDADGIKRALHRAKERTGPGSFCQRERIKKRKTVGLKEGDPSKGPLMHSNQKSLSSEFRDRGLTLNSSSRPAAASNFRSDTTGAAPIPSAPNKAKGSPSISSLDGIPKKKVKKRPSTDIFEAQTRLEKLVVPLSEERQKKPVAVAPSKPIFQGSGAGL